MATSEGGTPAPQAAARGGSGSARGSGGRASPALAAYVLHGWDWSESSVILDLLTRSQGRLVVAAKGAKKPTSSFRPVLLPFHALTVWLSRPGPDAADEVRALRAVEWAGSPPLPSAALMSGFYLNELLMKGLARQDPHPLLYDAYADTVATLAQPAADEGVALRAFELVLLRELGVLPALDLVTLTTEPVRSEACYALRPEVGLVPAADGLPGTAWVQIEAALAYADRARSAAALRQACRPVGAALRGLLRSLVHYHLETAQMRTRRVGLELQRLVEPNAR
jgi:DNA repair protein RecO (recombination protein O)